MYFLIDGEPTPETYFWNKLQVIASERQRYLLLEGKEVFVADSRYKIIFDDTNITRV